MQEKLSVIIKHFKNDVFYGDQGYAKVIIKHELSELKKKSKNENDPKNVFFTRGMTKYTIDEDYETLYFFINDPDYAQFKKKIKRNEKKQEELLATGQLKDERDAFDLAFKKQDYVKKRQGRYNNDTENLIHLWLFNGLKKYDNRGVEKNIFGKEYLVRGKWENDDLYINAEDLRLYLLRKEYPLPGNYLKKN